MKTLNVNEKKAYFMHNINLTVDLYKLNSVVWYQKVSFIKELNLLKGTLIF